MCVCVCMNIFRLHIYYLVNTRGWHLHMLCTLIFVRGQNLDQKFFILALH